MSGPGWGSGPPAVPGGQPGGWQPWSGGAAGASRWPPGQPAGRPEDERPYTGPPPTGRYAAPVLVPQGPPTGYRPPVLLGAPGGWPGGYPAVPQGRVRPTTPPGAPPFDLPEPYLLLMRARDWAWWRPVLGLLLFTVVYLVAVAVLVVVAAVTGVAPDLALQDLTDPLVMLVTNASLIVAIASVSRASPIAITPCRQSPMKRILRPSKSS